MNRHWFLVAVPAFRPERTLVRLAASLMIVLAAGVAACSHARAQDSLPDPSAGTISIGEPATVHVWNRQIVATADRRFMYRLLPRIRGNVPTNSGKMPSQMLLNCSKLRGVADVPDLRLQHQRGRPLPPRTGAERILENLHKIQTS